MTSKKKVLLCSKCMIFSRRSKIWEQHILKSLEKKKLWNNYWPVDTKKKLYFFVGQNFFFSVAWPSALRATEKKNFDQQKKNFFLVSTGQKLFQSFFFSKLFKICCSQILELSGKKDAFSEKKHLFVRRFFLFGNTIDWGFVCLLPFCYLSVSNELFCFFLSCQGVTFVTCFL